MSRPSRIVAAVLLAAVAGTASGCFSLQIAAPPLPARVRVLPADAPAEVSIKYQTFYYAWGLFPMTRSDRVQYIVDQERLVEARVVQGGQTQGIVAGLLGTFALGGFILPQNLTIEGNRTPTLGPLPAAE